RLRRTLSPATPRSSAPVVNAATRKTSKGRPRNHQAGNATPPAVRAGPKPPARAPAPTAATSSATTRPVGRPPVDAAAAHTSTTAAMPGPWRVATARALSWIREAGFLQNYTQALG